MMSNFISVYFENIVTLNIDSFYLISLKNFVFARINNSLQKSTSRNTILIRQFNLSFRFLGL